MLSLNETPVGTQLIQINYNYQIKFSQIRHDENFLNFLFHESNQAHF